MSADIEPCHGCAKDVLPHQSFLMDEFGDCWHLPCWDNEEQNKAERAFERSLNGDSGGSSDERYRAEMKDAGRGHLL